MGKKTFAMLIVAVVALFAGYNLYQSQSNVVALSELALANMEALAGDEGGGGTVYCCGGGECMRVVDGNGNISVIAGTRFSSPCP